MARTPSVLLLPLVLVLSACGDAPAPGGWRRLARAPEGPAAEQLARATAARDAMFESLFARLQAAVKAGGPAQAITVCSEAAPQIADAVSKANGLRIGRTSARLRNAANAAPDWATPYVGQTAAQPVYLENPDGRFAALLPIQLKQGCLGCHGPREALAEGVPEALARLYPDDRATGYAAGDLRGWFWIEVPRP